MKLLERERAFATLGLARLVDPASIALVAAAIYQNNNLRWQHVRLSC